MRLLLSGGLIAPMVFVGGFLAQGAIQPGYKPVDRLRQRPEP